VDDNEDAAKTLGLMLAAQGHLCETAFDGMAALKTAIQFRPDVFLLDIGMPQMSGHELAARLRAHDDFKTSTMIAVTGWGQPSDRQKCLDAGFDRHLVKPIGLKQLLDALEMARPG
jgi:CheY-like chemotaxis protein